MDYQLAFYMILVLHLHTSPVLCQRCPVVRCDVRTLACPYRTYFVDTRTRLACRGCNFCIKPDSPVDSEGCPTMECPGSKPADVCNNPIHYNSWVDVNGKQCPTCWAQLCKMWNSD